MAGLTKLKDCLPSSVGYCFATFEFSKEKSDIYVTRLRTNIGTTQALNVEDNSHMVVIILLMCSSDGRMTSSR